MAELKTVADFKAYLIGLDASIEAVNANISKIKNSLATAIANKIQEGALRLVGIDMTIPEWAGNLSFGAFGIFLDIREQSKLKPYLKELVLLKQEKDRVEWEITSLIPREAAETEKLKIQGLKIDPLTGRITTIQRQLNLDNFTESTGIPKLLRKYNIDPRVAYLAYPLGIYVGAKVLSKFKRKRK